MSINTNRSWKVESITPCKMDNCKNKKFTTVETKGNRPPLFRCDKCGKINYKIVPVHKGEKK